jgi:uncharacterized membrane protein YfcA
MMMEWLFVLMPLAAFLYASVGHGGASSYLMLLTWLGFMPDAIRPGALMLNLAVSGIAFLAFQRKTQFPLKLFLWFMAGSVPASFLGAGISLNVEVYRILLGVLLLFPVLRLFGLLNSENKPGRPVSYPLALGIGALIGLLSGMIGIGGGILLSPVLLLLGWADLRQTAAMSALFIFVNSAAGLAGIEANIMELPQLFYSLLPLTLLGGMLGAWLGANRFKAPAMLYALGIVLLIAAVKFLTPAVVSLQQQLTAFFA